MSPAAIKKSRFLLRCSEKKLKEYFNINSRREQKKITRNKKKNKAQVFEFLVSGSLYAVKLYNLKELFDICHIRNCKRRPAREFRK